MIQGYVSPRQAEGRPSRINFIEPNYSPGMYKTLAKLNYRIRLVCFDCSKWLVPLTKEQMLQLNNFLWKLFSDVAARSHLKIDPEIQPVAKPREEIYRCLC